MGGAVSCQDMRTYLGIVSALAALVVLYEPLTGSDAPGPPSDAPRFGIAARYASADPPGIISCHGPTLSILVEADRVIAADSRTNDTVVFAGHDWARLATWIDTRKRAGGDELARLEIATHAVGRSSVPYQALVAALGTGEASGFEPIIVEPARLVASIDAAAVIAPRNAAPDPLSPDHGN